MRRLFTVLTIVLIASTSQAFAQRPVSAADATAIKETALNYIEGWYEGSVKIVASDWIDYLHLAKYDGRWVIVNVLWELKPATSDTNTAEQQARRVEGQILTSTALPAVRLQFDNKFKYVGNQSFILYDNARVEQYFFVDADGQGRIKRLYWVQFEGYLPNNTETYNYKVNKTVNLGGLSFIADAYARNIKDNSGRPGSDGSRA